MRQHGNALIQDCTLAVQCVGPLWERVRMQRLQREGAELPGKCGQRRANLWAILARLLLRQGPWDCLSHVRSSGYYLANPTNGTAQMTVRRTALPLNNARYMFGLRDSYGTYPEAPSKCIFCPRSALAAQRRTSCSTSMQGAKCVCA